MFQGCATYCIPSDPIDNEIIYHEQSKAYPCYSKGPLASNAGETVPESAIQNLDGGIRGLSSSRVRSAISSACSSAGLPMDTTFSEVGGLAGAKDENTVVLRTKPIRNSRGTIIIHHIVGRVDTTTGRIEIRVYTNASQDGEEFQVPENVPKQVLDSIITELGKQCVSYSR